MTISVERALPVLAATAASVVTTTAFALLHPAGGATLALTVAHALPAGARVTAADLVRTPVPAPVLPAGDAALYAQVALLPGQPLTAGDLSTAPPPRFAALGSGIVAENVTLAAADIPAGAVPGQRIDVAGTTPDGSAIQLLASGARILTMSSLPAAGGAPASDVLTLALPLPSALVVAGAARAGTVALLPWQAPAAQASR